MNGIALLLCFIVTSSSVFGEVTLQFSNFSSALTNLSGEDGTQGEDGLLWGIVIDTGGDGFGDFAVRLNEALVLENGLEVSPGDYFFIGGVTSTIPPIANEPGAGAVTTSSGIPAFSVSGVEAGLNFAIVWFGSEGTNGSSYQAGLRYGILEDPDLLLPPDFSSNVSFVSLFAGPDPVRSASSQVQPILPPIDCRVLNNRFAVEFVVNATTSENVSFDLEVFQANQTIPWQLAGVSPQVIASNGALETIRLSLPDTVTDLSHALVRVQALSEP